MSEQRLQTLIRFYEEDPNDPFNLYGLALEYQKTSITKSDEFFVKLLHDFPEYVPAYYHAAKLKIDLGQTEQALEIFKKGITIAKQHNAHKASQELNSAYQELLFDLE